MEERLSAHLSNRIIEINKAKAEGAKIIGYFPSKYMPDEIIYASGAIPLCLADGGDSTPVDASLSILPRNFCSFMRAQTGELVLKRNPFYNMVDMIIVPMSCQHLAKLAEIIEYKDQIDIYKLGIPHQYDEKSDLEYYTDRLLALKNKLQTVTGNTVTNERLSNAIAIYNKIRESLKKISLLRSTSPALISGLEFIKLNHASLYADPVFMGEILEYIHTQMKNQKLDIEKSKPRILLIGPNIAYGDYKILNLIEAAGAEIVIEEVCEGVRDYWQNIEYTGNPFESLARGYFSNNIPCAFMIHSAKRRFDFAMKLINEFNVSGVIWYELLGCESYDSESYFFGQLMEKRNIPMLILEADYGMADLNQMKIRVEAFIETIKEGL